jgi:two-component system response regulator PilR (NtrC family)
VEKYTAELEKPVERVSDEALARLIEYDFPGNVRELENVIERAVALCRSDTIDLDVLPPTVLEPQGASRDLRIPAEGVDLDGLMGEYEKGLLLEALRQTGGVKKKAAQRLGISFRSFRYRLEKLRLDDD